MRRLVIVGASGHGKVVADIAVLNGYTNIIFVDDDQTIHECAGYPVVAPSRYAPDGEIFIAIGNAKIRKQLMEYYQDRKQPSLIHPHAVVAKDVEIGDGCVVMAGSVINAGTKIGKGCIVNTCSSVDHDCVISDYVHVSIGAHVAGAVQIGARTWIGAGATVSNNISICGDCMIDAGAVVIKNIEKPGTYVGVPAKEKKMEVAT